jgi:hypothetical protein
MEYKVITDGPVRAIFQLNYKNVNIMGLNYTVSEEISIWGGQYFYQDKVTVEGLTENLSLVTGIVNMKSKESSEFSSNGSKVLYTHDLQSENNDYLAMALVIPEDKHLAIGKTPDSGDGVINTFTADMKIAQGDPATFRFYAGWEKTDPAFSKKEFTEKYLLGEALKMASPVSIK